MNNLEWLKSKGYSLIHVKCERCKKPTEKIVPSYKSKRLKEEGEFTCEICRKKGCLCDKIINALRYPFLIMALLVLALMILLIGKLLIVDSPINYAIHKQLSPDQEICNTHRISEDKMAVLVNYDCHDVWNWDIPIEKCKQYSIIADKTNGKWLLNQSTKVELW